MTSPLFTDLYQFTMAEAYAASGKARALATFELFFRRCPFGGEYAVVGGYDLVKEILETFEFSKEDIRYIKSIPAFEKAPAKFFEILKRTKLNDIEVLGIPEGELAFSRVPILQVRGPILKAQLLETAVLNAVNFATLVATYARRIRMVAGSHDLIEFGVRRAQGPNGAMTATRASYLGGFDSTSNVLAGHEFKIPVVGTMAHSFVQSFSSDSKFDFKWNDRPVQNLIDAVKKEDGIATNQGELTAFFAYAKTFPDHCVLLVDTYDTLGSGVPNAVRIFKILKKFGHKPVGIRLDSGDLVYFSRESRRLLNAAGFKDAKIFATNELDEEIIESLQDQGAAIDAYGVGTRLVTAAAEPALGGVYKLVELDGAPRMKISQQTEKLVIPSAKRVYRLYGEDGLMMLDLLASSAEAKPKAGENILALHPSDPFKKAIVSPARVENMLTPLFRNGKWLENRSLEARRKASLKAMKDLRSDISRRANPTPYKVSVTSKLKQILDDLYHRERPAPMIR